MGLMDKIKFWKHDEFSDLGMDSMGSLPPADGLGNDDPFAGDPFSQPDPFGAPKMQGHPLRNDLGMGNHSQPSFDSVQPAQSSNPFMGKSPYPGDNSMKDIEIISAKIETVRVSLENLGHKIDNMNIRLAAIEKIANDAQNTEPRW